MREALSNKSEALNKSKPQMTKDRLIRAGLIKSERVRVKGKARLFKVVA